MRGGLAAGILFVLPSIFVLLGLSWIYAAHGAVPAVAAVLAGVKAVVVAIVLDAVLRIGKRALKGPLALASPSPPSRQWRAASPSPGLCSERG